MLGSKTAQFLAQKFPNHSNSWQNQISMSWDFRRRCKYIFSRLVPASLCAHTPRHCCTQTKTSLSTQKCEWAEEGKEKKENSGKSGERDGAYSTVLFFSAWSFPANGIDGNSMEQSLRTERGKERKRRRVEKTTASVVMIMHVRKKRKKEKRVSDTLDSLLLQRRQTTERRTFFFLPFLCLFFSPLSLSLCTTPHWEEHCV